MDTIRRSEMAMVMMHALVSNGALKTAAPGVVAKQAYEAADAFVTEVERHEKDEA